MLDWSLPGGHDQYFKAISDLAASDRFTGEEVMEISKKFCPVPRIRNTIPDG